MKSFAIAAATIVAVEARNLARMEAQPTVPALFALNGFTPVPTPAPYAGHLEARDETTQPVLYYRTGNTCGFISGVSSAPYYCINVGDYCALSTSAHGTPGRIACCGLSSCLVRTTCVGSADIYTSKACNTVCRDDPYIVKCTESDYPFCNTLSMGGGITDYACGMNDITTPQFLYTSYLGQSNPPTYTPYTATETETSASGSLSGSGNSKTAFDAPSSTSASGSSSASQTSTSTPTATNEPAEKKKSSTPVGAIVGGVVGGVGAIALAAVGVLLFLRNKKKKNQQGPPPMSQPQDGPPQQPQYAYQDPNQTAYSTSPGPNGAYYPPQQGSPDPKYQYPQSSVSPVSPYSQQAYSQAGYAQPYQQGGSPPPMQHQYASPQAGAHAGPPAGPVHEAPADTSDQHRGEMQELP